MVEVAVAMIWSLWSVIKITVSNPLLLAFVLLGIAKFVIRK